MTSSLRGGEEEEGEEGTREERLLPASIDDINELKNLWRLLEMEALSENGI